MNWKHFWDKQALASKGAKQVGRIMVGKELEPKLMLNIAQQISKQLQLKESDKLLDVCCGNAYLSHLLLPYCQSIVGVDFSEKLIAEAQKLGSNRMDFFVGDARNFCLNQRFDKTLLYFSFQYFEDYKTGKEVIQTLWEHTQLGGKILIGDICDKRKFFSYYNSPKKLWNWFKQKLNKRNDMGKFWHPNELLQICEELGIKGKVQAQQTWQPYAHYRFDFLIEK
ncbi:MAG: class I SAM-dependent methyltransferase [Bacteroidia bacterium]|jgi:SAM-dependent methyltransferase